MFLRNCGFAEEINQLTNIKQASMVIPLITWRPLTAFPSDQLRGIREDDDGQVSAELDFFAMGGFGLAGIVRERNIWSLQRASNAFPAPPIHAHRACYSQRGRAVRKVLLRQIRRRCLS